MTTKENILQNAYEYLDQMGADEVLNQKLLTAQNAEDVYQIIQSRGYLTDLSFDEFNALMEAGVKTAIKTGKIETCELSDEELELVAGGGWFFRIFKDILMTAASTAIGFCAGGPAGAVAGLIKGVVSSVIGEVTTSAVGSAGAGAAAGGFLKMGMDVTQLLVKLA